MAPRKIIVFTDLHMAVTPRSGTPDPFASLRAGLDHVARYNADAERIILCGDLAHHGDEASYDLLRECLATSALPVHPMLGNHDDRAAFRRVFPDCPLDENGFVQRVIDLPEARLILLDTLAAPAEAGLQPHAGYLCAARLDWLSQHLGEASDKPALVFMHHPPHATGFASMDAIMLANGEAFYDLIERHGTVQQLICGHIHRTISGNHRGTPFAVFKSPVGQMPLDFDSLDCHIEVNEPAAYGILLLSEDGVLVHSEDYGLESQ